MCSWQQHGKLILMDHAHSQVPLQWCLAFTLFDVGQVPARKDAVYCFQVSVASGVCLRISLARVVRVSDDTW